MTVLAWTGTALQILGALVLAGRLLPPRTCYAIMWPGAAMLLGVAVVRHDWPQVVLMFTFVAINSWGLARWKM